MHLSVKHADYTMKKKKKTKKKEKKNRDSPDK